MTPNLSKGNQLVKKSDERRGKNDGIERTISDMTLLVLTNEEMEVKIEKCECCEMSEECSEEYTHEARDMFCGKFICGLCGEAVKETMHKNGGKGKEAVDEHMKVCVKFNKMGRSYPVLYQVEAIKKILKKASTGTSSSSATNKRSGTSIHSRHQ